MIDSGSDLARLLDGEQRRLADGEHGGPVAGERILRSRGGHRLVADGADRARLTVERLLGRVQLLVSSFDALGHVGVVLLPPPQSTVRAAPQDVHTADENHSEDRGDGAVRLCETRSTICKTNPSSDQCAYQDASSTNPSTSPCSLPYCALAEISCNERCFEGGSSSVKECGTEKE